jgi:hypothetical protein
MRVLFLSLIGFFVASASAADSVIISEFMARNQSTLADEDGAYSDWIELQNTGTTIANLDGWYLTDATNNLVKWRIPATNVPPQGFLVIFASGKNRAVPGAPLHANFNLSGSGEYLALIRPDGVTIASEFAPAFPEQFDNISYGIGQNVTVTKLISSGASARTRVPPDDSLGLAWTQTNFDHSSWLTGATGIGFSGTNTGISTAGLFGYWPMREGSGNVTSNLVAGGASGTLNGGAAWVTNDPVRGTVLSFNGTSAYVAAGTIPRMGLTTSNFTWSFWYKQISAPAPLSVILGNRSGGVQSPLQFVKFTPTRAEFYRAGSERYLTYSIPTGQWIHLALVKNGSALTYYANGAVVATATAGADMESNPLFFGGDPGAAGEFSNGLMDEVALWTRALNPAEITSLVNGATPLGFNSLIGTDVAAAMLNVNASAYLRVPFNVGENDAFNTLKLRMKYDDGFVAYLNGTEIARRNAPATLAFNSSATAPHANAEAVVFEDIDVSQFVTNAALGTNILAVHGLNVSPGDADFLVLPELDASQVLAIGTRYFANATPGGVNDPGFLGLVDDTKFSHDRGFYDTNFNLTVTCNTVGATIRYTTNGLPPTETTGLVYSGPITISRTTTLRAAAYKAGYQPSNVDTHTYIFVDNVLSQTGAGFPGTWGGSTADYAMDQRVVTNAAYAPTIRADLKSLPVVSIVMDPNQFFGPQGIYSTPTLQGAAYERPCSAEMFFPDGSDEGFQIDCGIRISGGASRNPGLTPKHGVRLLFKTAYGASKLRYQFFENTDVDRFDSIAFRPNFNMSWVRTDNSGPLLNGNADGAERTHALYIRDQWTKDSYTAMGAVGAHERFVHLYINGLYWGLYNPCERTDASFAATYFGGEKEEYDAIFSDLSSTARAVDGDRTAWNTALAIANAGLTTSNAYHEIQKWVDVTNLADYMMLNFYCATVDWPWQNWNALRKRGTNAQFKFIVWDAEYTLDTPPWMPDDRTPNVGAGSGGVNGNDLDSPARFYFHLKNNPEWRLLFADRAHFHFFNNGVLTSNQTIPRFLGLADTIDRAIVGESARWGDVVRTAQPYTRNAEWLTEKQRLLTNFFAGRTERVVQHFRNAGLYPFLAAPSFNQHGAFFSNSFALTISAPVGTIYYTTNGADPRLEGGAVSPDAFIYTGPINLNASRGVRARAFHTNTWSAVNDATFIEATPIPLRITEIMFNPYVDETSTNASEDFEYIEIRNISSAPLSLSGVKFTKGITFNFSDVSLAGGQHALIVRNLSAFQSRHGTGLNVLGQYTGSLSDDGENVRLVGPLGERIHDFEYRDWFQLTDGLGFSLVIRNESGDLRLWNEREGWRVGGILNGSPGVIDPPSAIHPVRISEILTHTDPPLVDTIELYNPCGMDVDLGGWFLTDDARNPKKFRIPDGTIITNCGYLVFEETVFGAGPSGFSLSSHGEEVYLYSGDANTNLTGYAHGTSFGAAANGVSFARYTISTGEDLFPAVVSYTPGMTNSQPIIGPVVFTEIMYNPLPGDFEFVELKNISSNTVPLFHVGYPSNTWRISGLNFDFPPNTLLAPGEIALVAGGNTAEFRQRHNLAPAVQIFSFGGSLQNDGENIELQRPDFPDGTFVPYITVEAVRYNDRAPWPVTADGHGPSIHKRHDLNFANEPLVWVGALPNPGQYEPIILGGPTVAITSPASQVARGGTNVTLTTAASGFAPYYYQWFFNGSRVAGETNSTLNLINVQPPQSGAYSVLVFSPYGSYISSNAYLTVLTPPLISAPPTNLTLRLPTPSATTNATFRVIATGAGALSYQWSFNGLPISGATNPILALSNIPTSAAGAYAVAVSDSNGWAYASATLGILVTPFILEHPQTQVAVVGDTVNLRVKVVGTEPFGFRWRRNGVNLTIPNYLPSPVYTITNVNTNHAGAYTVIITNAANFSPGIQSLPANLTVLVDSDGDHAPDVWESANGFNTGDPGDALVDSDGDSMTNLEEYIAGTDPRDEQSYFKVDSISAAGGATVSFLARSNKTYTVQYNSELAPLGWSNLVNVLSRPTNRVETITDPAPGGGRVYRLVTPLE